jgi:hypothetical protein
MPAVPGDLRWAAARFASYIAKRTSQLGASGSLLPERAASVSTEGGLIVFAVPTQDRPTGLPEVDAVLFRYAMVDIV